MNRELQRWTIIIGLAIFVFGVLAAFVPQWIYKMPYQYSFGLRKMCAGGYCGAINFSILQNHIQCRTGCHSTALIRRWRAVEAFIWIAAASSVAAVVVLILGFRRDLLHTARVMGPLLFFLFLGVVAYVISVSIFGATLVIHSNPWRCPYASGCFYYGASIIAAFTGMAILFVAFLLALFSLSSCSSVCRGLLLAWAFLLAFASIGFALGAALSPKWVILSQPYTSLQQSYTSIGPINTCDGGYCHETDLAVLSSGTCATVHGLRARFGVALAFLILAFIFALLIVIFAWMNWPATTFVIILFTLAFFIVGISVMGNTWDWYFGCGFTYCDNYTLQTGYECQYGFAFAAALVAVLLTVILAVAFIIMFACRKADRMPDTTQVAVTTIAQPPVLPVGPRVGVVAGATVTRVPVAGAAVMARA